MDNYTYVSIIFIYIFMITHRDDRHTHAGRPGNRKMSIF